MRMTDGLIAAALLAVTGGVVAEEPACVRDPAPREAVVGYITAMKEHRFEDAHAFVTATMTDGRPVAEWAALQKRMFELGGVEIGAVDVRAGKRELADGSTCAPRARVPNVLHAGDVLNNQGSTEFEVYTVVEEGGRWRIDSQETLFDEPAIRQWFPADPIPDFKDTADPR